jgi:pimeloyl-ACP methyl ester carboxylesterase
MPNNPLLPVAGHCLELNSQALGRVMLYHAGPGGNEGQTQAQRLQLPSLPPLLLVHSVNAAGTAAEMAPLHAHYSRTRPVYSMDLPGFGLSERSDRAYTPRLMTDAILEALKLIDERHPGQPVDALGLSLACEFVVRAALEVPQRLRRLVLVSPTGFNGKARRYGPAGSTLGIDWLHACLAYPAWGSALFRGLTRPGVIRYFLQRSWGAKKIDETLWRYDVWTTRQAGAHHAPLYFLSAHLFSKDINSLYETLTCPVWVSMATRGDFTNYTGRASVQGKPNWQFHSIEGGALPYFEDLNAFVALLDPFWEQTETNGQA